MPGAPVIQTHLPPLWLFWALSVRRSGRGRFRRMGQRRWIVRGGAVDAVDEEAVLAVTASHRTVRTDSSLSAGRKLLNILKNAFPALVKTSHTQPAAVFWIRAPSLSLGQ